MLPPDSYFADPDFQRVEPYFHDWVAQGQGRNAAWVAGRAGLPIATVGRAMVAGMWLQRLRAIDKDAATLTHKKLVGDVSGLNEADVAILSEAIDLAWAKLKAAIEADQVPPALLWKIVDSGIETRAERLGMGQGGEGDIVRRMQKVLEAASSQEAKPFVLDPLKLESPPDLPAMPGMTSDEDAPPEEGDGQDD